jgi:hypothetical protein
MRLISQRLSTESFDMVSWDQHRVDAHQAKFTPPPENPSERGVDIEGDLHDDIEKDLKARRWYYTHSRMDKPATNTLGTTDFVIAIPGGRTLWLEAKRHGAKLSKEQTITRHILLAADHWHETVYSMKQYREVIARKISVQVNCQSCGKKCYQPVCHECQNQIKKI